MITKKKNKYKKITILAMLAAVFISICGFSENDQRVYDYEDLYTEEQETTKVTVPDVIGKTQAEVNQILAGYGLNIALTNSGIQNQKAKATTQSPPAGTEVEKGSVVTVEFLTNDETG